MLISDIMKTRVITIPSTTSLAEARRIMDAHKIRRLPIVENQQLVGIITKDDLDKVGPLELKTYTINEMVYMLNKMTVEDVMHRDVVTVPPDTTVEAAIATAQGKRVGSLLVMDQGKIAGIVTTNDFFLSILNPLLGIGLPGSRIAIADCCQGPDIEKVVSTLNALGIAIISLYVSAFLNSGKHELMVHIDSPDPARVVEALRKKGFTVEIRPR